MKLLNKLLFVNLLLISFTLFYKMNNEERIDIIVEDENVNNQNFMNDEIDGIKWNNPKRTFKVSFVEILKTIALPGRTKLIIKDRFVTLYEKIKYKRDVVNKIYNTSRIIVTIFGVIVPALITIDNEISEKDKTSLAIGYMVFTMSLISTIINSLSDVFQINKRSYLLTISTSNLEIEAWLFLSLSGKYKYFLDHVNCWKRFLYRVEKINSRILDMTQELHEIEDNLKVDIDSMTDSINNNNDNGSESVIYVNR